MYFSDSHPALIEAKIVGTKAVYTIVRNQNDIDGYKKSTAVVKEVTNFVMDLSPENQTLFVKTMKNFRNNISIPRAGTNLRFAVEGLAPSNSNDVHEGPMDLSINKPSDLNPVINLATLPPMNVEQHNNDGKHVDPPAKRLHTKV